MARRIKDRVFNPAQPLIARRKFTANGRVYEPGQPFAWKDKAIPVRRVATLFSANLVDHEAEKKEEVSSTPVVPKKEVEPAKAAEPAVKPEPKQAKKVTE